MSNVAVHVVGSLFEYAPQELITMYFNIHKEKQEEEKTKISSLFHFCLVFNIYSAFLLKRFMNICFILTLVIILMQMKWFYYR